MRLILCSICNYLLRSSCGKSPRKRMRLDEVSLEEGETRVPGVCARTLEVASQPRNRYPTNSRLLSLSLLMTWRLVHRVSAQTQLLLLKTFRILHTFISIKLTLTHFDQRILRGQRSPLSGRLAGQLGNPGLSDSAFILIETNLIIMIARTWLYCNIRNRTMVNGTRGIFKIFFKKDYCSKCSPSNCSKCPPPQESGLCIGPKSSRLRVRIPHRGQNFTLMEQNFMDGGWGCGEGWGLGVRVFHFSHFRDE